MLGLIVKVGFRFTLMSMDVSKVPQSLVAVKRMMYFPGLVNWMSPLVLVGLLMVTPDVPEVIWVFPKLFQTLHLHCF